ncbi:MAG: response regulator [Candidatus Scalindua sp.]|nr:response regulator [Candidatus Scalindua sp.]
MAGEKILVVDDIKVERIAFEEELTREGYEVDTVSNGKDALRMIEEKSYDIIFIDYVMPVMNGMATGNAIGSISPDSEIVLMTGKVYISDREGEKFFRKEGNYYLYKPLEEGELLKITREVLDRREAERVAGERILIVDDVLIEVTAFEELLSREGYLVDIALSGEKAVEMVKQKKYDIVFIDMVMPGMNGIETCKAVKETSPDTISILITGLRNSGIVDKEKEFIYEGGEIHSLYKPFKEDAVLEVVRSALAKLETKKILVIDDVLIEVTAFEEALGCEDYQVDFALSGKEAVKMAEKKRYDIIFIDLVMPEMNGIETCKAIKKVSPDSIPIFFTGKISTDINDKEIEFMNAGGEVYYLYKPFEEGVILETARKALGL